MACASSSPEDAQSLLSPVTIEHDERLAPACNAQHQSPLFSKLPREIRDLIWEFATAPVEDEGERYKENEYYCRPGHRAKHKTYTALLYTCRRVWLEANAFPMLQAEHCFWYHRAAPDHRTPWWMASLTKMNRHNFGHLHLFAQMFAIEGLRDRQGDLRGYFLKSLVQPGDFQPRMLHVTIRHTDWWFWEDETPLRFEDRWFQAMLDSPDLRSTHTLKLELETLHYKVDQLMPIVDRLKRFESKEYVTHLVDGKLVKTRFVLTGEPEVFTWSGPVNINGQTFVPYQGKSVLNYHVVTLTWRLTFPEIPRAHVPEVRRAPRVYGYNHEPEPYYAPRTRRKWHQQARDPMPGKPREPWYFKRPARVQRRPTRGLPGVTPEQREDMQMLSFAQGLQRYLIDRQKWQAEVGLVTDGLRFHIELEAERRRVQEQMEAEKRRIREERALAARKEMEARWEAEGSLLKFEQ